MALKDVVRKVYNKLLVNNEGYLKYLRSCGVTIGEDVTFHCPEETHVDVTDPHLLTIGDHVNLTGPITILTHDFSWSVVKGKTGEILGNEKPVTIGNNVFVGWGATILCGTTIEDNVIIGAHAVVSGHVEGDSVWGGVPARRICSLEHYQEKRAAVQVEEAKEYVRRFRAKLDRDPMPEEIREYFPLFADPEHLCGVYESQMRLMGTWDKSLEWMKDTRVYRSYEEFLDDC